MSYYYESDPIPLKRRTRKCETCPYLKHPRTLTAQELKEAAEINNQDFPCHTDDGYAGNGETSCRGHWEASRYAKRKKNKQHENRN